jgi:hypothetical protein
MKNCAPPPPPTTKRAIKTVNSNKETYIAGHLFENMLLWK